MGEYRFRSILFQTRGGIEPLKFVVGQRKHHTVRSFTRSWNERRTSTDTQCVTVNICTAGTHRDNLAFAEAFNLPVIETTSGNASQSNLLRAQIGGRDYILWEEPRMTQGEMVCHLTAGPKPLYRQTRTPLREKIWSETNDPTSRRYGREGVGWEAREGYGGGTPFATFQATA